MLLLCYHGNNVNLKLARFPGRPAHKWRHEKLPGEDCSQARRPQCTVGSTGGRNTLCEHISGRLIHQGFSGSLVEPSSEEHTSELPSLMRNSYAVFSLKK